MPEHSPISHSLIDVMAKGNKVIVRWTARGTHQGALTVLRSGDKVLRQAE